MTIISSKYIRTSKIPRGGYNMKGEESALLLKTKRNKKYGSLSNQARGAYFNPYKAQLRWHAWVEDFDL